MGGRLLSLNCRPARDIQNPNWTWCPGCPTVGRGALVSVQILDPCCGGHHLQDRRGNGLVRTAVPWASQQPPGRALQEKTGTKHHSVQCLLLGGQEQSGVVCSHSPNFLYWKSLTAKRLSRHRFCCGQWTLPAFTSDGPLQPTAWLLWWMWSEVGLVAALPWPGTLAPSFRRPVGRRLRSRGPFTPETAVWSPCWRQSWLQSGVCGGFRSKILVRFKLDKIFFLLSLSFFFNNRS